MVELSDNSIIINSFTLWNYHADSSQDIIRLEFPNFKFLRDQGGEKRIIFTAFPHYSSLGNYGIAQFSIDNLSITKCNLTSSITKDLVNEIDLIRIFPNPTHQNITILKDQSVQVKELSIIDMIGNIKYKGSFQPTLNLASWEKGVYFIQLWTNKNMLIVKKIILTQ